MGSDWPEMYGGDTGEAWEQPGTGGSSYSELARLFTTRPPETEADMSALRPITDRATLTGTASRFEQRLRAHSERLRANLGSVSGKAGHLLTALQDGDFSALSELGIDIEYAWLDDVVGALVRGAPYVEMETIGPYAAHHLDDEGVLHVRQENLPDEERVGILLAAMLRDVFGDCPNFRMVALLDDYHGHVAGTKFSPADRDRYVVEMYAILHRNGVLSDAQEPGRDYVLVREHDLSRDLDAITERLRHGETGSLEETDLGDLVYRPTERLIENLALDSDSRRRDFRRNGILLARRGRPTCHALDAAGFLNPINKSIAHVVVLDQRLRAQQDKVYALLRAVGQVTPENYHNVFFDAEHLSPALVAYALSEILLDQLSGFLRMTELYANWEEFDPGEYTERNYGRRILPEDRDVIAVVTDQLARAGLPPDGLVSAADVGAGPTFYPAMLLAPYLAEDGQVSLIEYTRRNRDYLMAEIDAARQGEEAGNWSAFEELMVALGGSRYGGALRRAAMCSRLVAGSIFELPVDSFDLVTSFFVAESITTSRHEFRIALRSLAGSVRDGGMLIVAHMVGSLGWTAGVGNRYPALRLGVEEIEEAYRATDLDFELHLVGEGAAEKARDGYQGMAVVTARRSGPGGARS